MYKISLIIPVYNVEKYIEKSLYSALRQSFESLEIILVDDCGTDNSLSVANSIINNHPRKGCVRIVKHDKNRGLSAARNTGVLNASGEFIFFMDSDDEISSDCIQLHYSALISSNADFTIGNVKLLGSKSYMFKKIKFTKKNKEEVLESFLLREWPICAWNKLYKKVFLQQNNICFIENILYEDILYCFDLSMFASKVVVVNEQTYIYKIRPNSIVSTNITRRNLDNLKFAATQIAAKRDMIPYGMLKIFDSFLNHVLFKNSLLLFRSNLLPQEQVAFFNELRTLRRSHSSCIYDKILMLPYLLFKTMFIYPYFLYKLYSYRFAKKQSGK